MNHSYKKAVRSHSHTYSYSNTRCHVVIHTNAYTRAFPMLDERMFLKCGLMPFFLPLLVPIFVCLSVLNRLMCVRVCPQFMYNKFYRVSVADRVVFELVCVRSIPWLYFNKRKAKKSTTVISCFEFRFFIISLFSSISLCVCVFTVQSIIHKEKRPGGGDR